MKEQKKFIKYKNNEIVTLFTKVTQNLDELEIQRTEYLEEKEIQDYPSFEFSRYINIDVPLSVSRLSIIPNQEDAPSNILSTLSRRFLELQAVRAEVMLMTFEVTIDILLPVHIYLLSNYNYDYRVKPPSIKTFIQITKKKKLVFSRAWGRKFRRGSKKRIITNNEKLFRIRAKTNFLFYLKLEKFVEILFKRILAEIDPDDDINIPTINKSRKLFKNETGVLRSLHVSLFYCFGLRKYSNRINQRRRELNP